MNKKHIYISLLLIFFTTDVFGQNNKYNLAADVADNYLKSFSTKKIIEEEELGPKIQDIVIHELGEVSLDAHTQIKVSLGKLIAGSKQLDDLQNNMEKILNEYAWDDLKLYYGTTTDPTYNLMTRVNRTNTKFGESVLATMIATPSSNIDFLKERQEILKTLLKNDNVKTELINVYKSYQSADEGILSFWTKSDPLYTKDYTQYMNKKFFYKAASSNKSAGSLELSKRFFRDFWDILSGPLFPLEWWGGMNIYCRVLGVEQNQIDYLNESVLPTLYPFYNIYHVFDKNKKKNVDISIDKSKESVNPMEIVGSSLITAYWVWGCYSSFQKYKEYSSVLKNLALRLYDLQVFLISSERILEIIEGSEELKKIYSSRLQSLKKLLAEEKNKTELGDLIKYLKEMPLASRSYFFNNTGKLLASYKLFIEYKDEFKNAFYDFGRLDAFLSFATLIKESKKYNEEKNYNFVNFLDRSEKGKPFFTIKEMWNPFLDAKVAVVNTLEMDSEKGIRNIILTGPNAGGKSTFITGITSSLLLAQIMGIAPAKDLTMTLFNKISTYIDIVDDIAAGKSLFMAEVDRAQKHINMIKNLRSNEFSFTIFDEPFSGTNPYEGAAAEYSILEALGKYPNTLTIVATHYPKVMLLEKNAKDSGFKNYKVYIKPFNKSGKKKINYTYKVIPGRSHQAIAIDILEAAGYDTSMLARARDIIKNPQKYETKF